MRPSFIYLIILKLEHPVGYLERETDGVVKVSELSVSTQ